ncbi:MAG: type II toxin-antitoxin system RelE/ParE family toxin [Bryobacterales bacterium]|nr:type II toxin-antitoxin system RelE/ParE family toxin [Bryobacterales bacterium]
MKRLFVLTREARGDLREILGDIAEDGPDTAERVRSEFYAGLQTLGRSPGIGHYHDELLSRKYRFWNFYSYVVVYVWQARPIQVVSVIHGARDLGVFLALWIGEE